MTLKSGERWRQLELPCVETCGATWPRRQYHAYVFKAIDFSLTLRIDYTLPLSPAFFWERVSCEWMFSR